MYNKLKNEAEYVWCETSNRFLFVKRLIKMCCQSGQPQHIPEKNKKMIKRVKIKASYM